MRIPYSIFIPGIFILFQCKGPEIPENALHLDPIMEMPLELNECSGMVMLNDSTYVAINDGGDKAVLYKFTGKKSNQVNKIRITGAGNNDWEELTLDENFIYVGDFGNNSSRRRNLKVYKIKLEDLMTKEEAPAEMIQFSYKEQTEGSLAGTNNFDCEAMVSAGDSLYLFTKNRANLQTDLYRLPKIPGSYVAQHVTSFDVKGLISGAAFRNLGAENELVLVGYETKGHFYEPFLLIFNHVKGTHFFRVPPHRVKFDKQLQLESVLFKDDHHLLLTSEEGKWQSGFIYKVDIRK